jgi:hypothetical protein
MNSTKSGNVKLTLQAEAVEDTLADEVDPLLGRHLEPGGEIVVVGPVEHRHGPASPGSILDEAFIGGWGSALQLLTSDDHVSVARTLGDGRATCPGVHHAVAGQALDRERGAAHDGGRRLGPGRHVRRSSCRRTGCTTAA